MNDSAVCPGPPGWAADVRTNDFDNGRETRFTFQAAPASTTGRVVRVAWRYGTACSGPHPAVAAGRSRAADLRHAYAVTGLGGMHHPPAAHVEPDVPGWAAVEDQISGAQVGGADRDGLLPLGDRVVRERHARARPRRHDQTRAVEGTRAGRRPDVRRTDLGAGVGDGFRGGAAGGASATGRAAPGCPSSWPRGRPPAVAAARPARRAAPSAGCTRRAGSGWPRWSAAGAGRCG